MLKQFICGIFIFSLLSLGTIQTSDRRSRNLLPTEQEVAQSYRNAARNMQKIEAFANTEEGERLLQEAYLANAERERLTNERIALMVHSRECLVLFEQQRTDELFAHPAFSDLFKKSIDAKSRLRKTLKHIRFLTTLELSAAMERAYSEFQTIDPKTSFNNWVKQDAMIRNALERYTPGEAQENAEQRLSTIMPMIKNGTVSTMLEFAASTGQFPSYISKEAMTLCIFARVYLK